MIIGIQDEILRLHSLGLLKLLLRDKTTRGNIIWATDAYRDIDPDYKRDKEIKAHLITGARSGVIKNRARKALEQQTERTRQHAEVFTPLWICKRMNETADGGWFPKKTPRPFDSSEKIKFLSAKKWRRYVDARRLEITCGEAPYLVSRYDVATGESIPIRERIGLLDRKLRVVDENTADEAEWLQWAVRAFQSIYGYEFQGDNVLIARVNLLMTFEEYFQERWRRKPTYEEYRKIANIITWNIWQMDGITGAVPYCRATEKFCMASLFAPASEQEQAMEQEKNSQPHCRLFDWRANNSLEFLKINEGSARRMKFDFVIGNPPYQDEMEGTSDNPIYNLFMDASYSIATVVELITPARFLFNAGKTPKAWNQKMLSDEHLQVLYYEQDSSKVFFNTDIKGGVVITYRDSRKKGDAIQTFTTFSELNTILRKVRSNTEEYLSDVVFAPESYKFTKEMYADHPEILSMTMMVKGKEVPLISKGHDYDLTSNIFDKLHGIVFFDEPTENSVAIFGRMGNERVTQYIERPYIANHPNLDKYKVFFPKANGAGKFGEIMTASDIGEKNVGHTQTFISIGAFDTFEESKNLQKYLMCKFSRALLYVLKVTQDNKKSVWKYVPLQDFTPPSDIDWSRSISEIDQQLYAKYGLDEKEIAFIESHVKEMR